MKQYTTSDQTANLIELGFENPKTTVDKYYDFDAEDYKEVNLYSIGELIEMLPMEDRAGEKSMVYDGLEWVVNWDNEDGTINQVVATDLIDALYEMIVKLKEEGVI